MTDPKTLHAQYTAYKPVWKKCRDATAGQRAVHAAGKEYLPALSNQTLEEYAAYLMRALYFNATGRTVEAMRGLVFRKDPQFDAPQALKDWTQDITFTGLTLNGLARKVLQDVLTVGRYGLLVDYPVAPATDTPLTVLEAQTLNLRPFISPYAAEAILNWQYARVGSVRMLVNVTLLEAVEGEPDVKEQVRELTMANGYYEQIIWREINGNWVQFGGPIKPTINGNPIPFIPFWFVSAEESDGDITAPPIEDLVYINLSHYLNSADLEHGSHFSGLPTLWVACDGLDEKTQLSVGSATALILPSSNAKVGFAQVGSEGFQSLEKLMDRKEQQMAAIGARLIAPEKKAAEAAETAGIRRGGENATLADIAGAVELPIRQCLQFMAEWAGLAGDVLFELNKDYLPMPIEPAMLTALVAALQGGAISQETFFENLQAGQLIPETVTFEDEQERIANTAPALASMTGATANGN